VRDAVGLQGLTSRVVDTGKMIADDVQSVNGELLWYLGPFWVQSETCLAHVDNAVFRASSLGTRRGDLNYYGKREKLNFPLEKMETSSTPGRCRTTSKIIYKNANPVTTRRAIRRAFSGPPFLIPG